MPDWANLIWQYRHTLGESQTVFGKRFGVSAASVSDWERSVNEAPYRVTWMLYWMTFYGV